MSSVAEAVSAATAQPGLYPGLTRPEYEAIPAINASVLEHFERSAAHAREIMLHPQAPTAAMDFGTALHCAVLEPMRFSRLYAATPKCDRRTKEGKATWADFEAEHPNAIALEANDFVAIQRMRESVWSHPTAKELLRGPGHNEVGIVWRNKETGVLCKGLMDRIGTFDSWTYVVDLKSTEDASRREFSYSIKRYNYGAKAAFYLDGCGSVAPRDRRFAWIAVEKKPPYAVALYEPDDDALRAGRMKYERWLRLYQEAVTENVWRSYPGEIQPLTDTDTEWRAL